jgi:hypothetical protein
VDKSAFRDADPQTVAAIYRNIDWVSRNKKGMKKKSIFICMFTTFIIALYEPKSPLRIHIQNTPRMGLGDVWTEKHCAPIPSVICAFLIFRHSTSAVKGLSYTTLIRLGILWGKGLGAYEKGSFGNHWGCHSDRHIHLLYSSILQKLKERENPFGPFDALTLLIGNKNARFFCQRDGLSCRPLQSLPSAQNDDVVQMDVDKSL